MACCSTVQNQNQPKCFCISTRSAWMLTAVVGAAILAFGVTALTSINGSATNPMHQLVHKVAVCVGSNPLSMPILVATVGGAFTLAATLGYGHEVRKAPTQ